MQYSLHVFDQLMAAGQDYGMKLAGAYSVDTLRLEKGYRHWGHELDTETTPLEAGLDFAVDMNKVKSHEPDPSLAFRSTSLPGAGDKATQRTRP